MMVDYTNPIIQELAFLMRIPQFKRHLEAMLDQNGEIFKNEISNLVKETAEKVRPMPTRDSQDYFFQLIRHKKTGLWETIIENNLYSVPPNTIIPAKLIFQLAEYDVDPKANYHLEYKSSSHAYKVYFARYTLKHIAGTVQKTSLFDEKVDLPLIEFDQCLQLSPEEQEDIFNNYLRTYPELKKEIFFYFFSRILPDSDIFKELTG